MPEEPPGDERQREYEQIKQDLMRRGRSVAEAEAIAARTVSRQRTEPPGAARDVVVARRHASLCPSAVTASFMKKPSRAASPAARR